MKRLQLYVWTEFNRDYSKGLAFAIAENLETARAIVENALGYEVADWGMLTVHPLTEKVAYAVSGGS